jgi:hypothetical protein
MQWLENYPWFSWKISACIEQPSEIDKRTKRVSNDSVAKLLEAIAPIEKFTEMTTEQGSSRGIWNCGGAASDSTAREASGLSPSPSGTG